MEAFFLFFGQLICHQLDERSFFIAGRKLPLCARCTGIYLGIFSSFIYLIFRKRYAGNKPVDIISGIFILICMAPLAFDGISSYFFGRETTNVIRLATGVSYGGGLPILYIMLFNFDSTAENNRHVIKRPYEIAFILALAFFICSLIFSNSFVAWLIISVIICASVLSSFISVFLLITKALQKRGVFK